MSPLHVDLLNRTPVLETEKTKQKSSSDGSVLKDGGRVPPLDLTFTSKAFLRDSMKIMGPEEQPAEEDSVLCPLNWQQHKLSTLDLLQDSGSSIL